jgi:hypothetical protein
MLAEPRSLPIEVRMWNYVFVHRAALRRVYARSRPA